MYLVLDCETGGLDRFSNPITEVFCKAIDKNFNEVEGVRFHTFVKPYLGLKITKEALNASHVKMSDVKRGADFKEVVKGLIKVFKLAKPTIKTKPIIVGHNIGFDIGFLEFLFAADDKDLSDYLDSNQGYISSFDTLKMSRIMWKDDDVLHNLQACCQRIGVDLENAHGAEADVDATTEVFRFFSLNLGKNKGNRVSIDGTMGKKAMFSDTFQF